jgi:signal peptidase I
MRRSGLAFGAAFLVALSLPFAPRLARSWRLRVAVSGHSMEPGLLDGDWILVEPTQALVRPGDVIVARDPRKPDRLLLKRVLELDAAGPLMLAGDHPAHVNEANAIGPVDPNLVVGRPWFRYWPLARFGPLRL